MRERPTKMIRLNHVDLSRKHAFTFVRACEQTVCTSCILSVCLLCTGSSEVCTSCSPFYTGFLEAVASWDPNGFPAARPPNHGCSTRKGTVEVTEKQTKYATRAYHVVAKNMSAPKHHPNRQTKTVARDNERRKGNHNGQGEFPLNKH